jgi:hypothetical protein
MKEQEIFGKRIKRGYPAGVFTRIAPRAIIAIRIICVICVICGS